MNAPRTSFGTLVVGGALLAASLLVWAISAAQIGGETISLAVSDFGEAAVVTLAGVLVVYFAVDAGQGGPLQRQWLPIGLGVLSFAVGDWIWAVIEVVMGQDPYPSVADVFYLAMYGLMALGMVSAALSYRHLMSLVRPALVTSAFCLVSVTGIYLALLGPVLADTTSTPMSRVADLAYPLFDVVLLLGPAVFLLLVTGHMGGGVLRRPWAAVGLGGICVAVADSGLSWLNAHDAYTPWSPVNLFWMLGFVLVAIGAMLMRDAAMGQPGHQR